MYMDWNNYRQQTINAIPTQTNCVIACNVLRVVEQDACALKDAYARAKEALAILGVDNQDTGFFIGMSIEDIYDLIK